MVPLNLNYQVDIKEQGFLNGDFIIQGTAISAVTTSNNHKFLSEELKKSANTLKGVPLLKDHENTIDSIMGRVLSGMFNESEEKVDFRAKVVDDKSKELIKQGLLNTVSVGAIVEDIEEENGLFIPRGITFKELSLVAVPADSGATFQIALKEAYNSKQDKLPDIESHLNNTREVKMTEEETQTSEETPKPQETVEVEPEPEETPEPEVEEEPTDKVAEEMAKLLKEVKALKEAIIKLKEADADEVPEVSKEAEPEPEPKVEVEEETETEESEEELSEGCKIQQSYGSIRGGSFTLVR